MGGNKRRKGQNMNTYEFNLVFDSEKECSDYIEQLLEKHEGDERSFFRDEVVWSVETECRLGDHITTLKKIRTWGKH